MHILYRLATSSDIPSLIQFIFEHGPNPWNYLPEDGVRRHLEAIATGDTWAILAACKPELIGFVSCNSGDYFPQYEPESVRNRLRGYIAEGVVHKAYIGRGIGTELLEQAKAEFRARGINTIYLDRHEENAASAGMMRKAGFALVDTIDDPQRRTVGSRRTAILRFTF